MEDWKRGGVVFLSPQQRVETWGENEHPRAWTYTGPHRRCWWVKKNSFLFLFSFFFVFSRFSPIWSTLGDRMCPLFFWPTPSAHHSTLIIITMHSVEKELHDICGQPFHFLKLWGMIIWIGKFSMSEAFFCPNDGLEMNDLPEVAIKIQINVVNVVPLSE